MLTATRDTICAALLTAGIIVSLLTVGAIGGITAVARHDTARALERYDRRSTLHFEAIRPSLTRGIWVRYRVEPPVGDTMEPYHMIWVAKPWRGLYWM